MKNKMIVALLVCMVMIIQTLPMFGSRVEAAVALAENSDLKFAKTLGIIDDSVSSDEPVTRIELAKVFSDILLNGAQVTVPQTSFVDVSSTDISYSEVVNASGIMNGVGDGKFNPDDHVTYNQLLKSFVSFLGYDVKAQAMGGYPGGYIAVASNLDLIENPPPSYDHKITWGVLASMFRCAVGAPLMKQMVYSESFIKYDVDENENYLSMYMNISVMQDVVNATYNTNLKNSRELKFNELLVGDNLFCYDNQKYDYTSLLGYPVTVFYEEIGALNKIIYCELSENKSLNISSHDLIGYESGSVHYYDSASKKERKVKLANRFEVVYNTKHLKSYNLSLFESYKNSVYDGDVSFVDYNADGSYDIVMFDLYETYVVDRIIDNIIYPQFREGEWIDIGDYRDGEDVLFRNIDGYPVSLEDIEKGDILSVYRGTDGKAAKVIVTVDTFMGNISQIEKSGNEIIIYMGDSVYRSSNSLIKNPNTEKLEPGMYVRLLFNKDSLVSDVEIFESKTVAFLVDMAATKGLDSHQMMKIFNTDGEFEVKTLASKVFVTCGANSEFVKAENIKDKMGYDTDLRVKRQPIYYEEDSEGNVNKLWLCNYGASPEDGFFQYEGFDTDTDSPYYRNRNFAGKLILSSGVVIFNIPDITARDDEDGYSIIATSIFLNGAKYRFDAYGTDKFNRMADILVMKDESISGKQVNENSSDFLLVNITEAINESGDNLYKLVGYMDGAEKTFYSEKDTIQIGPGSALPESGDVLVFNYDKNNLIRYAELVFDESERKLAVSDNNPSSTDFLEKNRYVYGDIYYSDSAVFAINVKNASTGEVYPEYYNRMYSHRFYKYKKSGSKIVQVSVANVDDMVDYITAGPQCSKAYIHTYYGDLKTCIIYE